MKIRIDIKDLVINTLGMIFMVGMLATILYGCIASIEQDENTFYKDAKRAYELGK